MSVVYVSSLQAGKDCLRLVKDAVPIDDVVTIDAETAARARVSGYADFREVGLPVHHLHRYAMTDPRDVQMIRDLSPRLVIVNGWNRLIPPSVLAIPQRGCVGFHGSWRPLPAGRGRSPVTWTLRRGERQFFLHLFHLNAEVDSGDIIDTLRFDVTPDETAATLLAKIGIMSARLLIRNVAAILDGTAPRAPQEGEPSYLPKVEPGDGRIDWAMPMRAICDLVRAMTRPYRGAFGEVDRGGRRTVIVVWDAVPFSHDIAFPGDPGVVVHEIAGRPLVKCGDGVLLVKEFTLGDPAPGHGAA